MGEDSKVTVTWHSTGDAQCPEAALVSTLGFEPRNPMAVVGDSLTGAHPDKRPNRLRTRGPGKGHKSEAVQYLRVAIQELQKACDDAAMVARDMPPHERERLLIAPKSDVGFAIRNAEAALKVWERGGL